MKQKTKQEQQERDQRIKALATLQLSDTKQREGNLEKNDGRRKIKDYSKL